MRFAGETLVTVWAFRHLFIHGPNVGKLESSRVTVFVYSKFPDLICNSFCKCIVGFIPIIIHRIDFPYYLGSLFYFLLDVFFHNHNISINFIILHQYLLSVSTFIIWIQPLQILHWQFSIRFSDFAFESFHLEVLV